MTVATAAAGVAHERPAVFAAFPGKYLSVITFRRSGEPVATPVWFVEEDGRLYVDTDSESGKVKRIRANPHVLVAPCTASGKLTAPAAAATAEVIGSMPATVRENYARKYVVDKVLVLPIYRLVQLLKGGHARAGQPVCLVITLDMA